jgi:hypothetical protein
VHAAGYGDNDHSGGTVMNFIWRFYLDSNQRWKWQQLAVDRTVLAESTAGYKEYERCLANARDHGHVFHPSQQKLMRGNPY